MMEKDDLIRACFELAKQAKSRGDGPFGSIITDGMGKIIARAGNTTNSDRSVIYHAEINAIRQAEGVKGKGNLSACTLYTSAEPCPMCSSAIIWSGIDQVVFGVSINKMNEMGVDQIDLNSSEVFDRANRSIEIHGPVLEEEGLKVFIEKA